MALGSTRKVHPLRTWDADAA